MQKFKQYITEQAEDGGFSFEMELNEQCGAYTVTGISMFVGGVNEADEGDDACYYDGDLAVTYDISNLQNDETAQTMGMLLLRNLDSEDEVTQAMKHFYWGHGFDTRLREILAEAGFTSAETVGTSEWGMQDEGRASYDAFELASEIREAMLVNA